LVTEGVFQVFRIAFETGITAGRQHGEGGLVLSAGQYSYLREPGDHDIIAAWVNEMKLSHLDEQGRARMVDVGHKPDSQREAIARGRIAMQPETLGLIQEGGLPKGDVLATARIAGIMAAKRTHELIPMCHPLILTHIGVAFEAFEPGDDEDLAAIEITGTVHTTGKTGVEMEALTAVAVAGLTIYDMCKAVDRQMRLEAVRLVRKSGGRSGDWSNE
jgi:cyclic pyranopterin phosphate synthase